MKFYYTLTCIILPASMMAACSASGTKKPEPVQADIAITKQEKHIAPKKSVTPLIDKLDATASNEVVIPEAEKFPLTQDAHNLMAVKPAKRIYQFAFDKLALKSDEQTSLQEHAEYLVANPDSILTINGHSDTQGNQAYNVFLSTERAKKIAAQLIHYGVTESQIKVNGLGDSQPLNDVNNYKENRRVELEYNDSRVAIK